MTTPSSYSLQITEAPHGDLTGKKMAPLTIKVENKLLELNLLDDWTGFRIKAAEKLKDISRG